MSTSFSVFKIFILCLFLSVLGGGDYSLTLAQDESRDHEVELREEVKVQKSDPMEFLKNIDPEKRKKLIEGMQKGDKSAVTNMMDAMIRGDDGKISMKKIQSLVLHNLSLFRKMKESEVEGMIADGAKGKFFEKFLKRGTKANQFFTKTLRDSKAFPSLINLMAKRFELYLFLGISVGSIFLAMFLKWRDRKKKRSFMTGFLKRFVLIYGIRIGSLVYLFGKELSPLASLFKEVYLPLV